MRTKILLKNIRYNSLDFSRVPFDLVVNVPFLFEYFRRNSWNFFGIYMFNFLRTSGSESDGSSRKGSIKSRLGPLKKKNEPTGLTITLSRSNDTAKHKRKRSYESLDSDSDASEVKNQLLLYIDLNLLILKYDQFF